MQKNRKIIDTSGAVIISSASAVGGKEFEGPLGSCFDFHDPDDRFGQKTFEKSESEMQRLVLASAIGKCSLSPNDLDALFAGDLLNQCVSSAYGLLEYDIPYFPHVSCGWDNNPRFRHFRENITTNNTPENIKKALEKAKDYLDRHPELPPLVTVNSWNEWTETSYLEPDDLYGYGYLEAIRSVFKK